MPPRKRTLPSQNDAAKPARARGAGSVLRRFGTKLGVLESGPTDGGGVAQATERAEDAPPAARDASALLQTEPAQANAPGVSSVLGEELHSLNSVLAQEAIASEPSVGTLHSVLAGKKIAVIGFEGTEKEALEGLLFFQRSIPVTLGHGEAALVPAPLQYCDLVIANAPHEWTVTEPIDPGYLARTDKPMLVLGSKDVLIRLGRVIRTDSRDFIPAPWTSEDVAWRAAMLLSRSVGTPHRAAPPADAGRPEVVIAEDDTTTRALLSTMLSRYGMHCHPTDNGAAALDLVRSLHPDAAILDVSMPCMDGFQVLASIKQDPSLASTKVVLLTGRQTEVDVLQAFGLGADDFMTKPFSPMELAARLKRLLVRSI
jgi:two-component system, OmpR family, response regulator MtrA